MYIYIIHHTLLATSRVYLFIIIYFILARSNTSRTAFIIIYLFYFHKNHSSEP